MLSTTEEKLQERIKELSCLYQISSTLLKGSSVTEIIGQVCLTLKQAWQFSDDAVVELKIEQHGYITDPLPQQTVFQHIDILIFGKICGYINVHYDKSRYTDKHFLEDEQKVLEIVAAEVSYYYEKQLSKEKIALLQRSAERADRLSILGEITAGIAHELNTPLGNILGFAEFINERTNDQQIKQDSAKVIKAAIYSREIVKKLMFFSCDMPQHMEYILIKPIVEQALSLLAPNFAKAGLRYALRIDNPDLKVQLDPIQFTQLLFNILVNAIYVAPSDTVISMALYNDDSHYIIEIADQGPGIPEEIRSRIFEPFFTTKPFGEGTGLGLSVVHGIIKSHHGDITTYDNTPNGTVFKIKLPLKQS